MRIIFGVLMMALGGCSQDSEPQREAAPPAAATAVAAPPPTGGMPLQSAAMMAIPNEPEALKRLEAMGYTVHEEEGHLHAPGVKGCPAMAEGPVM